MVLKDTSPANTTLAPLIAHIGSQHVILVHHQHRAARFFLCMSPNDLPLLMTGKTITLGLRSYSMRYAHHMRILRLDHDEEKFKDDSTPLSANLTKNAVVLTKQDGLFYSFIPIKVIFRSPCQKEMLASTPSAGISQNVSNNATRLYCIP